MDYSALPDDLPDPGDDGACDGLPGTAVADLSLPSTHGGSVRLAALPGRTVLFVYPMTGTPGRALPDGWDATPGARGCTPQSCGFRDHAAELAALGAHVVGLSVQTTEAQREAAERLHLPYPLLSDADLAFVRALGLPEFTVGGRRFARRVTLVLRDGVVEHVFYPVFPPDQNPAEVVRWLRSRTRSETGRGGPVFPA